MRFGRGCRPVRAPAVGRIAGKQRRSRSSRDYAGGRPLEPGVTLEELGLSSLERIEMMVALEEALNTTIDEAAFSNAATVGDLAAPRGRAAGSGSAPAEPVDFPVVESHAADPRDARGQPVAVLLPLTRVFAWINVEGLQTSEGHLDGPVIFAANHQSHMDAPVILAALPGPLATARGDRDGQGILQGTLLPRAAHAQAVVDQQPQLLAVGGVLQHVSAAATRGGGTPDAPVCRRTYSATATRC